MAGVALPITQTLRIDLGYRYLGGVSVEAEGSAPPIISFPLDAEMAEQAVTLGLLSRIALGLQVSLRKP